MFKNAVGMDSARVASLVLDKMRETLGTDSPKWDEIDQGLRKRWMTVIDDLFVKCERQVQMSIPLATEWFCDTIYDQKGKYAKSSLMFQVLFEVLLRHSINLITAGTPVPGEPNSPAELRQEFEDAMNADWRPWIREKLKKMQKKK